MAQVFMKKEQMGNYSTAKPNSCTHTMNMFPYCPDTFNKTQDLDEKKTDLNSRDDDFFICGKVLYSSALLLETLRQLSYVSDRILSGDLFLYLFLSVDL